MLNIEYLQNRERIKRKKVTHAPALQSQLLLKFCPGSFLFFWFFVFKRHYCLVNALVGAVCVIILLSNSVSFYFTL